MLEGAAIRLETCDGFTAPVSRVPVEVERLAAGEAAAVRLQLDQLLSLEAGKDHEEQQEQSRDHECSYGDGPGVHVASRRGFVSQLPANTTRGTRTCL